MFAARSNFFISCYCREYKLSWRFFGENFKTFLFNFYAACPKRLVYPSLIVEGESNSLEIFVLGLMLELPRYVIIIIFYEPVFMLPRKDIY